MNNPKIALVHHCNHSTEYMTDKSYWFQLPAIFWNTVKEGNFVVTENRTSNGEIRNLVIGYVEMIKETKVKIQ